MILILSVSSSHSQTFTIRGLREQKRLRFKSVKKKKTFVVDTDELSRATGSDECV